VETAQDEQLQHIFSENAEKLEQTTATEAGLVCEINYCPLYQRLLN